MGLKGRAYKNALKVYHSKDYALQRLSVLTKRIITKIEEVTIFLNQDIISDKVLKSKISLLSSLLEVKKKLRLEVKILNSDSGKTQDSLGELLQNK